MNHLIFISGFIIIAVAARQISVLFQKIKLPLITGLLVTGIITGPYILGLIPLDAISEISYVNDISLAFIAFAAGSELYLKELRNRFNSILWNTVGQLVVTFLLSSIAVYFMADFIPFMSELPSTSKFAIAILAGTMFVARSPSSAIAIINEIRAKGPFTQTVLGVTVVIDVLVIILFAICLEISSSLVIGNPVNLMLVIMIIIEVAMAFFLGWLLSKILTLILSFKIQTKVKSFMVLAVGWGTFAFSHFFKVFSDSRFGEEIHFEPLLICIVGSFLITNYSKYRVEFQKIIHDIALPVYVAFFTLTGASVSLEVLKNVYVYAILLFFVRLITMMLGAQTGGLLAKDPEKFRRVGWMPYVTQAGIGLGLATEVASEFTDWGPEFATLIISVIVINQMVGPPLFKWSMYFVEEAHPRADTPEFDGIRDAIIFGLENQSVALAQQLKNNGWEVKIATNQVDFEKTDLDIRQYKDFDLEAFKDLDAHLSEAIVLMHTDKVNYEICELIYEHLGTKDVIVRLNDRQNFDKFHKLGALIVEPATAIVSLLDHFVRSPQATSLLLGMEKDQDTVDLEVINPNLHGLTLRELHLPTDIIILSIKRKGQMIISHGFTRLRRGDVVTVVGSVESLQNVMLRFDG